MVKRNTCVFISGNGTNLKALIENSRSYNFPIKIKLIVSNNKKAKGLFYAKKYSIPFIVLNSKSRLFEIKILNRIKKEKISLICLAGYMRILSERFINTFNNPIFNIHPSLLPKFKGTNTFERILKNREIKSGCTVHFVTKKLDAGKIILKKIFWINKNDNIDTLKKQTQKLEYKAYSEAIIRFSNNL